MIDNTKYEDIIRNGERVEWYGIEVPKDLLTKLVTVWSNNLKIEIDKLESTDDRLNSCLYINEEISPKVFIEVFDLKTKENARHAVGCLPRYPSNAPIEILKDLSCIDLN